MKLPNTLYILALVCFIIFFIAPIAYNWTRVTSPRCNLKKNIEFSTAWDIPNPHMDRYKVVLTYCNGVKDNDTIDILAEKYPNKKDIWLQDWFTEIPVYYAHDTLKKSTFFLFVCNIEVINWWTVIDSYKMYQKLVKQGAIKENN